MPANVIAMECVGRLSKDLGDRAAFGDRQRAVQIVVHFESVVDSQSVLHCRRQIAG